jgi:AcrR family transcriptional regulator
LKRPRTARGAKTFNAIQDAAVELIYEHGFEKMTNQMLARKVRIKKATLYHHISSKEDLLFQILKRATSEGIREAIQAEIPKKPEEQLKRFVELSLPSGLKRKREAFIANSELRSLSPEHRRIHLGLQRSHSDILRRILERGMAAGTFEVLDSHISTAAIQQMLIGTYSWYKPEGRLTEKELISIYTALAFRVVGISIADIRDSAEDKRLGDETADARRTTIV